MSFKTSAATHHRDRPFPTPLVCNPGKRESSNDTAGLEETIHGGNEIHSIAARRQVEIFDKGWLESNKISKRFLQTLRNS
jgi:hypothetical protein